jgi:hypothetical protein
MSKPVSLRNLSWTFLPRAGVHRNFHSRLVFTILKFLTFNDVVILEDDNVTEERERER